MVTCFILYFGQNWRNALCSWIMWGREVRFPFFLEVEKRGEEIGQFKNTHHPHFCGIQTLQPVQSSLALIL